MTTAIATKSPETIEYIPFGAADKIKLSAGIIGNFVAVPTKTGALPTTRDCIRFMMLCQAQRLNPFAGDAFLVGYDGRNGPQFSLITAHVALLKRAESSADFEGMESGVILLDEDNKTAEREGDFFVIGEKVVGGWARVHRKGRHPTYRRLAIQQRKPAYDSQFWQGHKEAEQIVKCAEADALRATFPTLLGGLYTGAEMMKSTGETGNDVIELKTITQDNPPERRRMSQDEPQSETATSRQPAPEEGDTPQKALEALVLGAGHTFSDLQRFGEESGNIQDAGSIGSFDEVPSDIARRLLKSKGGLLNALKKTKQP